MHFAQWGRIELLELSMPWYQQHLPQAKARAASHGLSSAWRPKMVGPEGRESPSTITPFLMWQQPHPIFLAELIYRDRPNPLTLAQYRELVFETADLLASFAHYDEKTDRYVLGPPLIPAQEVLLAVGLMAAGWDGDLTYLPGFPKEGWHVRAEGLRPLP